VLISYILQEFPSFILSLFILIYEYLFIYEQLIILAVLFCFVFYSSHLHAKGIMSSLKIG
jgi:hypothetical protein